MPNIRSEHCHSIKLRGLLIAMPRTYAAFQHYSVPLHLAGKYLPIRNHGLRNLLGKPIAAKWWMNPGNDVLLPNHDSDLRTLAQFGTDPVQVQKAAIARGLLDTGYSLLILHVELFLMQCRIALD